MANVAQHMICFRSMPNESHVRIDEGIKKGPRKPRKSRKTKPSDLEKQARNEAGKFLTHYTPETKAKAVREALVALECGARVEEVADKHGVPRSTLYSWLIGDERAEQLRTQFFDGQMGRHLAEIESALTPLDLARAREALSGWIKVAERRDFKSYGQKQEVKHTGTVTVTHALQAIAERRQGRIVDQSSDAAPHTPQVLDVEPLPGTTLDSQDAD